MKPDSLLLRLVQLGLEANGPAWSQRYEQFRLSGKTIREALDEVEREKASEPK